MPMTAVTRYPGMSLVVATSMAWLRARPPGYIAREDAAPRPLRPRCSRGARRLDPPHRRQALPGTPSMTATRTETDTFGPIEVPADRYWAAQTQRALQK